MLQFMSLRRVKTFASQLQQQHYTASHIQKKRVYKRKAQSTQSLVLHHRNRQRGQRCQVVQRVCVKSGGLFTSKAVESFVEDGSCSQNNEHCQRQDAHSDPQSQPRVRVQVAAGRQCWQHNHRSGTVIRSQLTQTDAIKTRAETRARGGCNTSYSLQLGATRE